MYLRPWLCPDPTQPGSSYYYSLTTPWPGAPYWLLTGVLMSNVLTQNFSRMSFGGPFLARGPTDVPCLLVNPAMLGAPLQLGALSVRLVRLWVNPALLMPISCHLRDCKALLVTSLTHVSSAIASSLRFKWVLYLYFYGIKSTSEPAFIISCDVSLLVSFHS